jgi:hypothetical protein
MMQKTGNPQLVFILSGLILILAAFIQSWHVSHDLYWFYDLDVSRDMAYVQQTLYGHFGKDPNFPGEFLWYNPLMSLVQTAVIKISGLPINVVMVRLGSYMNLLAPLSFFSMMLIMLDFRIALAGLLSYLFFATGVIPGFYAATYSPWMYPGVFMQFIFYINIGLCYQAFKSQKPAWFLALGTGIGIGFLGHTAPTVLIILILISLQGTKMIHALKSKDSVSLKKMALQSLAVFIPFLLVSSPFLYYIVGKYHLHFENRKPFEYIDTIFIWRNYKDMILQNLSVSLVIAVIGFIWFYKKFEEPLIRKILLNWFGFAVFMYFYSTLVQSMDEHKSIHLPGTVPSFHYFFYLKALQSVFYGFGLFFLSDKAFKWISGKSSQFQNRLTPKTFSNVFVLLVLICGTIYFPFYQKRYDFVHFRNLCLEKARDTGQIQVYYFIRDHIPTDQVFLSEEQTSLFPMMATARKMVSIGITFSNPYVNFETREYARNTMLAYLRDGQPADAPGLFKKYNVNYILLTNANLINYKNLALIPTTITYRNNEYTIFHIEPRP